MLTVFGAGAVGLTLAARLSRAGEAVLVCTRDAGAAGRIARDGIEVEELPEGGPWRATVAAIAGPPPQTREPVLSCVRVPDSETAAIAIARDCPDAPLVNVQNGIEGDAIFARHLRHVIGAVIRLPCTRVAPNGVRSARGGRLVLGAHPVGRDPAIAPLALRLRAAGFDVAVSERIADDRWLKLCFNLMSTPNALVRPADHTTPAFSEGKARLLEEARDVLRAAGVAARSCDGRDRDLDAEIDAQRAAHGRGTAARRTPLYNSVWQGLTRGAPLEVDALHRRIVSLGHRHGVGTPVNERVLEALERAVRDGSGPECAGAAALFGLDP